MKSVKVIFTDNTFIIVDDVKDWEIDIDANMFFLIKETCKVMIPRENVKIIGYTNDLRIDLRRV